ncbi:MAG TPA: two-component system response regulator CreB [Gallionellaceae bacterium]|nr:two-component system response regulator CreB [Gallionellaceae bacterium]
MSSSILIIEDETPIAEVLAYALKSEGYTTQHCTLGREALELLRSGQHALAIMDVGLPDMNGFEVCREARTFTDIPILFLTARSDEVDRIVGLEIGADDYVTKPFSPREVVARVRVILRRQGKVQENKSATWFEVDAGSARIRFCGTPLNLTRYEFLLLKHLLDQPGRIYARELLMDAIWRDALDTSDRTVDTHIKTLRAKLKAVRDDLDPIVTHRGMGYSVANGGGQ